MKELTILNLPNSYCSYYFLGLSQIAKLRFAPQQDFAHLNGKPFLVFDYQGKIVVIENDDPVGVDLKSYGLSDYYFATNKLKANEDYNWPKVQTLYPHYSINTAGQYLSFFGLKGLNLIGWKEFARLWYTLYRRPKFHQFPYEMKERNYMFFSGSIWKKEQWANDIRRQYIEACKSNPLIEFEGGMVRRQDGDPCGMPESILTDKFPAVEFSKKSQQSIIGFNNPAVMDAVSWRLAEYLNYSCFVISFPFKIDLPQEPIQGEQIHYIHDPGEFKDVIDFALKNPSYRQKVSQGGKSYFDTHCLPKTQAERILSIATGKN